MEYLIHILIMLSIYFVLTSSAHLLIGMTNLITLSHAAFFGIGSYVTALVTSALGMSLLMSLITVFICNGLIAFVFSIPTIKLKDDYFVLVTLGFQSIVYAMIYNWENLTQGAQGYSGISGGKLLGLIEIVDTRLFLVISILISVFIGYLMYRMINSPFGRVLKSMREDDILLISQGKNPIKYKRWALVLSAAFCGVAGYEFATYTTYINPSSFNLNESIFILSAVLIGGIGNVKGSVLGAILIVVLPELFRFIPILSEYAAPLREISYAFMLLLVLYFMPKGLAGNFTLK